MSDSVYKPFIFIGVCCQELWDDISELTLPATLSFQCVIYSGEGLRWKCVMCCRSLCLRD